MNERILELMVKAGFDVEKLRMYPGGFPREDLIILEDFAKLIAEECVEVLLEWKNEPFPFDEDLAASLIKEHFDLK
jgi:hypothetical protein